MADIIGTLALLSSLSITFIGLPFQIFKNYKEKKSGLAIELILAAILSYTMWASYGWLKPDWFLATAQTPGAILAWIVFFQHFWYRKPKWTKKSRAKKSYEFVPYVRGVLNQKVEIEGEGVERIPTELDAGTAVYMWQRQTFGEVPSGCVAVSGEPDSPPWFFIPKEAVDWDDPKINLIY